jgi:hypothetical protein
MQQQYYPIPEVLRGPHHWDPESKKYVADGPALPQTVKNPNVNEQDEIMRGPHVYVPGENGAAGKYVRKASPQQAKVATQPPVARPIPGQPIRQQGR